MPALEDVTLAREAFSNAEDVEQESLCLLFLSCLDIGALGCYFE